MTKDSDKDVNGVASEAFSRAESSARSGKPVQDHELAWCSPSEAALTRADEKRRTIEEREREMVALARAHILTCGDFLLVQDLANHLGIHVELLSPALKEWEADHRIFSIDHDGCRSFPVYAFPSQGGASPIPGLRDVLSVLCPMKDGWGVSFWFISPNGWLGGKRPQDLLSTDPSRVISAAHEEVGGVMHG
ncbi:hypothetical protein JFU47_07920 [Pseudomonas sp. TH39(2020)]|uniref:hypothetical protein n=1 Tax=Pseudomonas sp. TH39(2020) TaxID=2796349 RepID=UPI0019140181|nr:hypothetical protein [Pseudomonas sp. TH39(2020)]MBK5396636.1 hypothetical protein [Pseudomonas sp. TH39(2020)]